ncbi:MAG TPA: tetratricopeptide repeat protein, partial [Vicinamibacterales bacterium]|nr:tetratricopeptide repeat protein [Vicinamibacterales bacterium]
VEALAAAFSAAGRLTDAVARYEELIALHPVGAETQEDWLIAHVRLGELYERTGRPDAARQRYEGLLALWKDGDADLVARKEAVARLARLKER